METFCYVSTMFKKEFFFLFLTDLIWLKCDSKTFNRVRKNSAEPYAEESGLEAGGDSTVLAELTTEQVLH